MPIVDPELAPLSTPTVDPLARRALADQLVTRAARARTARFLREHAAELSARTTGIDALLDRWPSPSVASAALVAPALVASWAEAHEPAWVAASGAAALGTSGSAGRWSASFRAPRRVRFGDLVTPPSTSIEAEHTAGETFVALDGGPRLPLSALVEVGGAEVPRATLFGAPVPLLGGPVRDVLPIDERSPAADAPAHETAATLEAAAHLLELRAPAYAAWVRDVLAAVVPIRAPSAEVTQSYSSPDLIGVVYASFPAPALKVAELLVHECSHTYFHVGELDTLFTNGTDPALYFSPYVQKDRPIDRILIAFHAFANIVLFYRAALAGGLEGEARALAEDAIAFHLRFLPTMRDQLDASRGLSPTGRGLYEPLRDEVFP